MDTIFGLPAHPLLLHIPIVLIPLAAIGVLVMLIKPSWHRRYRWIVLGMGAAGAIGAVLAAEAGEQLEHRIVAAEGRQAAASWQEHAEAGETARNVALVFLIVLLVFVLLPWWQDRRGRNVEAEPVAPSHRDRTIAVTVSVLAAISAVGAVATIVDAGHSGSKSVWESYVNDTEGETGG